MISPPGHNFNNVIGTECCVASNALRDHASSNHDRHEKSPGRSTSTAKSCDAYAFVDLWLPNPTALCVSITACGADFPVGQELAHVRQFGEWFEGLIRQNQRVS